MTLHRFSSWPFVALRGQKRCSPPPFVNRPNHDLAKVFFVVLRGPSWTKGVLSSKDQIMTLQRFSSWPFVVLRGQKRCSPPPFVNRPNHDLAKVFFVALRGPSWTKRCSPPPFVNRPNHDLAWFSSWPFVALRGQKGVPHPSWTDQTMPLQISVQTNVNEPCNPAGTRQFTIHYPLSPTPCSSPYPLPQDKGRFLRRTGGCGTVQPVWAVIHLVRVTGLFPPPRTT